MIKKIFILCLFVATTSCMNQNSPAMMTAADTATSGVGCEQRLQSKVFDSMYEYLDKEQTTPHLEQFKSALSKNIEQIALAQDVQDTVTLEQFKTEFNKIFDLLIKDAKSIKNVTDIKQHLQTLIEMEMQDQSSAANIQLNNKLSAQFSKVSALGQELRLKCNDTATAAPGADREATINPTKGMVAGMNNVFTTAYQSCKVLEVPHLTGVMPDMSGIDRFRDHADGIGGRRRISDLAAVQRTHPYITVSGNKTTSSCFDVYNHPLIYDYGGQPYIQSDNSLNLFKNAGSGEAILGIDCSALVAAAAAVGGLRYRPGIDNKAIFIRYGSEKFIDAEASHFTCYKNITVTNTESIQPGDIAAVHGHVVMVEKVGADPFGIKKIPNLAGCANIDPRNFDFVVTQSSAVKNGIGIDKYIGSDYILRKENPKMVTLFTNIAKASCEAYFTNTSIKYKSAEHGIIRHKGTAECLAPTKVNLIGQACVSQCQM